MGRGNDAVTRTFRINKMNLEVLEEEAKKESLSASALLNKILHRYVETTILGDKYDFINIPNYSLAKLLRNTSDEEAYSLGVESAKGKKEKLLNFIWRGKGVDDFIQFLDRNYGVNCGWFRFNHQNNESLHFVVAEHSFDSRWSHFIAGYLATIFQTVFSIDLDYQISENSVSFTFEANKT